MAYWSETEGKIAMHYFDLELIGHTPAGKVLEKIQRAMSTLGQMEAENVPTDKRQVDLKIGNRDALMLIPV